MGRTCSFLQEANALWMFVPSMRTGICCASPPTQFLTDGHIGDPNWVIHFLPISIHRLGDVLHDSERYRCLGPIRYQYSALRTSIRHPTYFGRVSFALSDVHPLPTSVASAEENSGPSSPLNIPPCTGPCEICSGQASSGELYPYHWQSDFTHVICCVIPCVSPFTPYGLAPYTGINDGTMDLALSMLQFQLYLS
jgi:hypothetical protein